MNDNVILETRNLVKDFPALRAVDNVDFSVCRGEKVFIVGPSGSGKSTFLRCLNMLEIPTSGQILFNGAIVDPESRSINRFREKVGMVFQHFNLFPNMNVLKNMTIAPTKLLKISTKDNSLPLCEESGIWIEDDGEKCEYSEHTRIGIDYASKEYREIKWRFCAK